MVDDVDWTHGADHMRRRHGVELAWANEALRDPEALRIDPDPSSKSGRSVHTIGYSPGARTLLTIITVSERRDHLWRQRVEV